MAGRINHEWIRKINEKIDAWKRAEGDKPIICVDNSFNPAIQWLVLELTNRNIPFRVIQLGAGVKRVTTDTEQCPKCHGTGRC